MKVQILVLDSIVKNLKTVYVQPVLRTKNKLIFAFTMFLVSSVSYAEIYKWVDNEGKVYYSDEKPKNKHAEEIKIEVNTYSNVTIDESIFDYGRKVIMYSTSWCGYCKKARNYFNKNGIQYTEYDIEKDKRALRDYKKLRATGVPVILVGRKRMNGFSKKGFERIYNAQMHKN